MAFRFIAANQHPDHDTLASFRQRFLGGTKGLFATVLTLAEQADRADLPDELSIPAELARRETRLSAIAQAKAEIEARAAQRFEHEHAEYQAKQAKRQEHEQRTGKPSRGKPPAAASAGNREQLSSINRGSTVPGLYTRPDGWLMSGSWLMGSIVYPSTKQRFFRINAARIATNHS